MLSELEIRRHEARRRELSGKKMPGEYKNKYSRYRAEALQIISRGKIQCVNCGCNDIRFLEINHKNGGGGKELGRKGTLQGSGFIEAIIFGRRDIQDLELRCRPCNHIHYLESKYGSLRYKINWE